MKHSGVLHVRLSKALVNFFLGSGLLLVIHGMWPLSPAVHSVSQHQQ